MLFFVGRKQSKESEASSNNKLAEKLVTVSELPVEKVTPEDAVDHLLHPVSDPIPESPDGEEERLRHLPKKLAISCSGCGFLGTYHIGVMMCFQRNAQV